jgi:hypothetical protein
MVGPSSQMVLRESMQRNQLWHMIRKTAANDPILKDMLDQVEVYYRLKYDDYHKNRKD